ncbi:EamA family transporter [Pseudoruegeria sp. HB172150]|uniref:EamA family transporter n=1 Tax=Pseudoruegeria sp. HB172150 TaxID=2721164 RepID=UPI0015524B3D|nr:EamA family transporter [Pseudoruegeria sp. HB172150]
MDLWIIVTIAAAAIQTVRFMLQKQIKAAGLSTGGATFSRFVFAAPLAALTAFALMRALEEPFPPLTGTFWAYSFFGGLGQIAGTLCTVALFGFRNFAVGIAFTKTETIQVALFSAVVLGEAVSGTGLVAILIGLAGVVLISLKGKGLGGGIFNRSMALGLLGGAAFGGSAIGYRGAALELGDGNYVFRAAFTLAAVTAMQTVVMLILLRVREPGQITQVFRKWRTTALVGVTGMLGSLGWFTAFTLQNAAYVRALGQVELIFSFLITTLVFHEAVSRRELTGIALLGLSVVMLVLYL